MGNCCRPGKSSMVWAGDDWDNLLTSAAVEERKKSHQNIVAAAAASSSSSSSSSTCSSSNSYSGVVREVKIRITKKELRELIEDANVQGIPVEQVLARLIIDKIESNSHNHQHPWKPTLNSIPE